MDTELARSFLAVVAAGSFSGAAERLHVSQSTVSARILALERQVGRALFLRGKGGASLTPAGRRFQRHAALLVRTVEQARQELGVPGGFRTSLAVGGRFGLWDRLLLDWLPWMRERAPDVSLSAEIGFEPELMRGLVEGRLDIAAMYTPERRPGLAVEPLVEEQLVLAVAGRDARAGDLSGYVQVDWGPEFLARQAASLPDLPAPALAVNVGWLGLQHILARGGAGYFPRRLVAPHVESGRLALLAGAPVLSLPAYVAYPLGREPDLVAAAVRGMQQIAERAAGSGTPNY
jgi:DNA-binding transcriptional LysR family regulator